MLKKQAELSAPPLTIESHKPLLTSYPPLPDSDSEDEEPSIHGRIASHNRKQTKEIIQAPLREAVGPTGKIMLVKMPFSTIDLEAWERIAKNY